VPVFASKKHEDETGVITCFLGQEALVQFEMQAACKSCGAQVLCTPDQSGKRILKVANPLRAQVGSRVVISERGNFVFKMSFIQYGIPLIGFVLGIIIFNILEVEISKIAPELIMFLGGLIGLGLAALLARTLMHKLAQQGEALFTVSKIL
jgi:sigma-E factor negative regulatory protein RseC